MDDNFDLIDNETYDIPWELMAEGNHFQITGSSFLNIALESSEEVMVTLRSIPEVIDFYIELFDKESSRNHTEITISGLTPNTVYYKYEDSHENHLAFSSDGNGKYAYTQDLSMPHVIFIQTKKSTIFLTESGWSNSSVGTWDSFSRIATLTRDVNETIQISISNVVIDGANHLISVPTLNALILLGRQNVTIKNCSFRDCATAIFTNSSHCTFDNCTFSITLDPSGTHTGIYINDGSGNNIINCKFYDNSTGISVYNSTNNTIKDSIFSRSSIGSVTYGIYTTSSSSNTIDSCTFSTLRYGTRFYNASNNNSITNSTFSNIAEAGVYVYNNSSSSTIENSSFVSNNNGVLVYNSDNNIVRSNTFTQNARGVALSYSSDSNKIYNNTISDSSVQGLFIIASSYNEIYNNNFINNVVQLHIASGSQNIFNLAMDGGGGNYWSNWTYPDSNFNGFVDSPYVFNTVIDNFPWTVMSGWLAPTTTINFSGEVGNNGWYKSNVVATFTVIESSYGSGVSGTEYSFDNLNWSSFIPPSLIISTEGNVILYFRSSNLDNINEPTKRSIAIKIDRTAPDVSITTPAEGASYPKNSKITAAWTASDFPSGIDSISASAANGDDIDTTTAGVKIFVISAEDMAGNKVEITITYTVINNVIPQQNIYFNSQYCLCRGNNFLD